MQRTTRTFVRDPAVMDAINVPWEPVGERQRSESEKKGSGVRWEGLVLGALAGIGAYLLLKALTEEE